MSEARGRRERSPRGALRLDGILGAPLPALERLGRPSVERRVGGDRWLVYRRGEVTVRVRCEAAEEEGREAGRVASWSVSFARGRPSLREAAEPLGLWPACAPDERPAGRAGLIRRVLPDASGAPRSLTATVRAGLIRGLSAWDEEPEWR